MAENQYIPIDDPKTLGAELLRLRQAAGVTLDDVVDETKVSRRIFEALENGDYQYLPEKVFCKNFLRQYLEMVGGDHAALTAGFEVAWEGFQENSGAIRTLRVEQPPQPYARWWVWLPFLLVAIVVVTLVVISIRGSRGPEALPPDPRRSTAERLAPQGVTSTPTAVVENEVVSEVDGVTNEDFTVTAVLRVTRGKECWVHYRDRDGLVGEALLAGGEITTLELPGPVLLTIGNADAATIEVGSVEYTELGKPGEVVRFLLDEHGLQPFAGEPRDE